MKRILVLAALAALVLAGRTAAQDRPAYAVFAADGSRSDYTQMLRTLAEAEAIFIGETHNCPIAHWIEYVLTRDLIERDSAGLTLGAEMLECDNQLLVDEYLAGTISSDSFESEAKVWDNHSTDYAPLLALAREHGLPFVATNVPRRYAAFVREYGLDTLAALPAAARALMAPLPVAFEPSEQSEAMFGMMQLLTGRRSARPGHYAEAQALKDATMAWSIAQHFRRRFIHYNGNFHSDLRGGIVPYLEQYLPGKRIATVCCVRQDEIDCLDEENLGRADFVVCVPTEMTASY